jgi:hypothetical protein
LSRVPSEHTKITLLQPVTIMICCGCGMYSSGSWPAAIASASAWFHCLCSKAMSSPMVRPSQDADRQAVRAGDRVEVFADQLLDQRARQRFHLVAVVEDVLLHPVAELLRGGRSPSCAAARCA